MIGHDQTMLRKYTTYISLVGLTSNKGIINDNKDDEDAVKYCKSYEEPVERVCHLLGGQNKDGEQVSNQTKQTKSWLKLCKM